ncbi:hypothetical protein NDU88_003358 [Pleurodeles waltl]|uniref:Uncharacterized protein n=1 Tax=Pleurodeles waltl TaxID=8319 RepID=A0AAV7WP75_PLEWA|nr:hypothetical protein NDU88_003358 [Pleurodeles waltl]
MPIRLQLRNYECQAKVRVTVPVLTECPVNAGMVSLPPRGKLEPGLHQCHSWVGAAGRGAPPGQAERDPEPGPAPCCLHATGREAWSQHQRSITFALGSEPRSVSVLVCISTPVLCTSSRSLSVLEAEPAYGSGRHPSRPRPWAMVRTRVGHLSPQWAASAPSLRPPLLLEVLGGEKVSTCLGEG